MCGIARPVLVVGLPLLAGLGSAHVLDVIYVDDDAPLGGDGTTWSTAYRYLQDALATADPGTEIHVAAGTLTSMSSV